MKKSFILKSSLIVIFAIIICLSFCGCSLINNITGSKLSSPTNVKFNDSTMVLSWDKVQDASSYSIMIKSNSKETVENTEKNSFDFSDYSVGAYQVSVRAINNKQKSDYSESIDIEIFATLVVNYSSIVAEYENSILTLSWQAVEHADGYTAEYVYNGKTERLTLAEPRFTISDYKQMSACKITISAVGSGYYKTGKGIVYNYYGAPDYENVFGTVTVDKLSIKSAVFGYEYVVKAILDEKIELDEFVDPVSESFVIPTEYLSELSNGEHFVYLLNGNGGRVYRLVVNDNRTPVMTIGNYVKDGEDLVGTIEAYGNELHGICGFYEPIDQSFYKIEGNKITLFADYLDAQSTGELRLNVRYTNTLDGDYHYLSFSVIITTQNAEIEATSYEFKGDDLDISILTHGDEILTIKSGNVPLDSSYYSSSKNKLTIKKSFFFTGKHENFTITTKNGAILSFSVVYMTEGFMPDKELYTFDKSQKTDLNVTGKLSGNKVVIYGNGLTPSDYLTSKQIVISKEFLSALDSSVYYFSAYSGGIVSDFAVKVYDSNGQINNLKLNYDLSESDTFITFNCDCGQNEHVYILDVNGTSQEKPCENMQVIAVDRTQSHILSVSCKTLGKTAVYMVTPTKDAIEYIRSHISVNGVVADKYIDSFEEFTFFIQYLVNGGSGLSEKDGETVSTDTAYMTNSFLDRVTSDENAVNQILKQVETSYPFSFSMSYTGSIATLTVRYRFNPDSLVNSGKTNESLVDNAINLKNGSRKSDYNSFEIDKNSKTERITTLGELERLAFGVKPVFASGSFAETVYNRARSILRTYVSDDMSDYEKVKVIYDYLISNVTYDGYAYEIFELRHRINGQSLDVQKGYIRQAIADNEKLSGFLSPFLSLTDSTELSTAFSNEMNSLSAFSSSGALTNGIAVCDGIASAFRIMCLIEGIDCLKVSGLGITVSGSENHAWNKVLVEDKWYIVDATWGRSSKTANHRYFMIGEYDASQTHVENFDSAYNSVVYTPANGMFDYYKHEKALYGDGDLYVESRDEFKKLVSAYRTNGVKSIELKIGYDCSSVQSEVKSLTFAVEYIVIDNVVRIIFK